MLYKNIDSSKWNSWHWQLANAPRSLPDLLKLFPNLSQERKVLLSEHIDRFNFHVTPYFLSCIELDQSGNPLPNDPVWRQIHCERDIYSTKPSAQANWETPEEIHFGILHQKYPGRALIRLTGTCFSYCTYCYCAHRTIRKDQQMQSDYKTVWPQILHFLKSRTDIQEVLLSGGDPLLLSNAELESVLRDLRSIEFLRFIRINTRAFTFCPFRFDPELVSILKKYNVNAIEVHFSTHKELTDEVDKALGLFSETGYKPLFLSRAPLLRGINDSENTLKQLLLGLYERGITPYYLFHYAPYIVGRDELGVPIRKGTALLRSLRRTIPGPAFPRFTLFHTTGKQDIPLDEFGTNNFRYQISDGKPFISFLNWSGDWVTYPDISSD
ncbi:MAG: KamA family radical SAM protein [Chitinispirillaceae bacterium]